MIYRIDVRTRAQQGEIDRAGDAVRREIAELGTAVGPIATWRIFLLDTPASRQDVARVASELLADPVVEEARPVEGHVTDPGKSRIEIHLKPGVMDPVADSTEMAIRDMGLSIREVRTGRAFVIDGVVDRSELQRIAGRVLANGVIESVHFDAFVPKEFAKGRQDTFSVRRGELRELSGEEQTEVRRRGGLFLLLGGVEGSPGFFR